MKQEGTKQYQNPEYHQYQEDEIELTDYLRVIWKWKWLIIAGTLFCVLAAGVYGFTRPVVRMYKVAALIEVDPRRNFKLSSKKVFRTGINSFNNQNQEIIEKSVVISFTKIKAKIKNGIYNKDILQDLQGFQENVEPKSFTFTVDIPKYLSILGIAYETTNPDLGKRVLDSLIKQVSQEYDQQARYQFGRNMSFISRYIHKIEALNEDNGRIKDSIAQTKKALQEAQSISDKLMLKRQPTFLSLNNGSSYEVFIYASAIKQVVDYPLVLREVLNRQMLEKHRISETIIQEMNILRDLAEEIGLLKNEIEPNIAEEENFLSRLKLQIDLRKGDLSHIKGIIVRQPPTASIIPIKYKINRNMILAGVVGLFMFLFLAFFLEYIKRNFSKFR